MTDNTWRDLTDAQRALLRRLRRREEYPEFEIISRDGIHDNTVKALQARGLIEDSYVLRLTDLGRAVYEARESQAPATDELADLRADTDAAAQSLTTALMKCADKVTELRTVLKATRDHIETFRNKVEMPPTVYVTLTDMTLRIDAALDTDAKGASDG